MRTPHAVADALPDVVLRREAAEAATRRPKGSEALEAEEAHKVAHLPVTELSEPVPRVSLSPAGHPRQWHRNRPAVSRQGVLPHPVARAARQRAKKLRGDFRQAEAGQPEEVGDLARLLRV